MRVRNSFSSLVPSFSRSGGSGGEGRSGPPRAVGPQPAARRYVANSRESRHARRMEAEPQAEEARERKAAEVERRRRDVLSGAVGCCAEEAEVHRGYAGGKQSVEEEDYSRPGGWEPPAALPWDPYAAPLGEPGGPTPTQMAPKGSLRRSKLSEALRQSLVFEGADEESRAMAVAEMREIRLYPGEMLAEEGQACWGVCVVESGTLDVFHYDASTEELAGNPGPETALHQAGGVFFGFCFFGFHSVAMGGDERIEGAERKG